VTSVAWLVDIGYVVRASENKFELDYVKTERFIEERWGPTQTFLFNGFDPAYGIPDGLQAFYHAMRRYGMQVRLHPMQSGPPGTNRQRRVDVDFGAHLVWQASLPQIQTLVLTTGDQDFIPAVELARTKFDKRVILFTYDAEVHNALMASVNDWWLFEDHEAALAR
jgi:uncharacterized LabA/DUF88 family protein